MSDSYQCMYSAQGELVCQKQFREKEKPKTEENVVEEFFRRRGSSRSSIGYSRVCCSVRGANPMNCVWGC